MPVVVATFVRALIQTLLTTALLWAAQTILFPLLEKAIKEIAIYFGCTEQEAEDIIANEILYYVETGVVLMATLKSKMPTKIAERLGFTSRGFSKRKLRPELEAKIAKVTRQTTVASAATSAEVATIATEVAAARGVSASLVSSLFNTTIKLVGITTAVFFAAAQYIDFANWEGPYQGTFQKVIGFFGLEADKPNPKARTISDDVWSKIYATVEELNPESIGFPWLGETRPYSRAALADAVDHFAANLSLNGRATSFKEVFALLLPCIKLKGKSGTAASSGNSGGLANIGATVPQIQVFTGVMSQGYLGKGVEFQARPDDMIENAKELIDAATNNIAPFLASLPGLITYQIKIVSSVTTKDGFVQKGSAVQVISRYDSKGLPVYKTVVNKFAVVELAVMNDKNTRVKFKTIILGPVDSVKFSVSTSVLSSVDGALKNLVSTSNVGDIKGLETISPVTVTTPKVVNLPGTLPAPTQPVGTVSNTNETGEQYKYYIGRYGSPEKLLPSIVAGIPGFTEITEAEYNRLKNGGTVAPSSPAPAYTPAPQTSTPVPQNQSQAPVNYTPIPSAPKPGANAQSLSEWYTANGRSLPSVQERSLLYQQYNLGSSTYYTGTAEQNSRLLNVLKSL